jgi:uncharacterized protein
MGRLPGAPPAFLYVRVARRRAHHLDHRRQEVVEFARPDFIGRHQVCGPSEHGVKQGVATVIGDFTGVRPPRRRSAHGVPSLAPAMLASSAEDVPAVLLSRIIDAMRPEQIWLFGSRVRGGARPMSDWDLLVVLPDDVTDEELDLIHAWQIVRDLRIPADVIPVRLGEFEAARDHAGTLVRTVVSEGRCIYAR